MLTICFQFFSVGGDIAFFTCSFYFEKVTSKTRHHTVSSYSLIKEARLMIENELQGQVLLDQFNFCGSLAGALEGQLPLICCIRCSQGF